MVLLVVTRVLFLLQNGRKQGKSVRRVHDCGQLVTVVLVKYTKCNMRTCNAILNNIFDI